MKRILGLVLTALLAACATPEGMRKVTSSDKVVYDLPSEGVDEGDISGVTFDIRPFECVRSGYKYVRDTKLIRKSDDRCAVNFMTYITTADNTRTTPQIAYDTYLFSVTKSREKGFTRVEFKPLYEGMPPYRNFGSTQISPPHSVENALEVLATSGVLVYRFQVASPMSKTEVTNSLQKYFKQKSYGRQPVTVMNRSFSTAYLLQSGENTIATFYITLQPLEKGTQLEVITTLRLAPDDNYHVDAVGQVRDLKRVIADAVTPVPPESAPGH
ncbi:hypothetical protein [Geomonas sp.]|uniref:hypothetical protein n=1 Tax=Geomonas sp. TaxID=2651584 RepID=UPI002B4650F6|nr:hypothetical protein [Geomonas sp.]HJV34836.1 hypothetical protein [Geomonas sp.]